MDNEQRYEELNDITSEIILLGHIMHRIAMVAEYGENLGEKDFYDSETRNIWRFLKEYYKEYSGEELDQMKVNVLYSTLKLNKIIKFQDAKYDRKPYQAILDFKGCGGNVPADNEAFHAIKKYSMLRALMDMGYSVDKICKREDFRMLKAQDISCIVYEGLDGVLDCSMLSKREDFGSDVRKRALQFLEEPEIGLQTPFEFINHYMHGLCKNDLTLIGGISNSGKGRFLMYLLVWLIAHEGQKVCLLSNEMTGSDIFKALICTITNMSEIHDKNLKLTQTEIVQTQFKDADGAIIKRLESESTEDYNARLMDESPTYTEYVSVLEWWEENFSGCFHFVNVADNYSTERLKLEIRKAKEKGCTVIAYDTLKSYQSTEWGDLVQVTTDLSEMIKGDESGLIGLATFQLTDDVAISTPEDLNSMKIARAKGIMHLADSMIMFMHLDNSLKWKYLAKSQTLDNDIQEEDFEDISEKVNIAAFRLVKNRRGGGKDKIYAVQNNLDTNRWLQVGELVKKYTKAS